MNVPIARDILAVIISYLFGAIPFSHLIARWRAGIDIREHGEGNVGARNVYHVVGATWGVAAAVLDIGKGLAAYLVADGFAFSQSAVLISGLAAFLGHGFSPFLHFRGGKGVAVATGFLLGMLPLSTLTAGLLAIAIYLVTRDVNKVLLLGIPGLVLLPPLFGAPLWTVPYALSLFLMLAAKKAIDRTHERAVWARDPWVEGQPGFHQAPGQDADSRTEAHT
jgi:glycerol-3-phosphate acyltransferase PlsY